jgi:hypothetical protein
MEKEINQEKNMDISKKLKEVPVIYVNDSAKLILESLCDVALKVAGIKNLITVNTLLTNTRHIKDLPVKPEEIKEEK